MKIKGSVKKSKSSKVSLEGKPRRASFSQVHFFVFPAGFLVSFLVQCQAEIGNDSTKITFTTVP